MTHCYESFCEPFFSTKCCSEHERTWVYRLSTKRKRFIRAGIQFNNTPEDKQRFVAVSQHKLGISQVDGLQFIPKLYDIWSFNQRDPRYGQADYKWGLIAGQIVENLLYYFTREGDTVLDPMAGGGTTIDVCKVWNRQCLAFDIEPAREDILRHDMTVDPPVVNRAQLAILDPPYFNMRQNAYKIFNDYLEFLRVVIQNTVPAIVIGGHLALVVMDQIMKDEHTYPLIGESYQLLKESGVRFVYNISLPLMTEQFNAQQLNKGKEQKRQLGINRQMWVFKKW